MSASAFLVGSARDFRNRVIDLKSSRPNWVIIQDSRITRQTKSPTNEVGLCSPNAYATLRNKHKHLTQRYLLRLRHQGFKRPVGLLGQIGIELANLGGLGHKTFVGGLGVFGLHLDRLVE